MKKAALALVLAALALASACDVITADSVVASLGRYAKKELYSEGDFQDYTDYGKYFFENARLDGNRYFSPLDEAGVEILNGYIDNFESWIDAAELAHSYEDGKSALVENYDFDRECVDANDYYCVDNKSGSGIYENYTVYFFDAETGILYFYHSNI